jgi:hypothetical protein
MAFIEIFDGSFPAQSGMFLKKSAFVPQAALALKDNDKKQVFYNIRNAVQSVEIVTPDDKKPGIKISLKDGKVIVARTDRKTIEDIRLVVAAGPDETGDVFITQPEKKTKSVNPHPIAGKAGSLAAQTGRFVAWLMGLILGVFSLGSFATGQWYAGIILLAVGAMIIPPVLPRVPLFKKKQPFAKGLSIVLVGFIVLIIGGMFTMPTQIKKLEEFAAAETETQRQERKDAYAAIKDDVLKNAREALKQEDFPKVVELTAPYTGLDDEVLDGLHADATQKIQEKAAAEAQEANRKAEAERIINEVRAYTDFLDATEEQFKTMKPSEADLDTIRKAATTFSSLAESLNTARQNKSVLSPSDITYLKGVEKRLSAAQQRLLPGLRVGFGKRASQILWEHDTYVTVAGDGNRVINITAGMFASNANIKAAQEQLGEVLTKLRFKEVRYRWYKGADEFTYYKLETPPDAKLSFFEFGRFKDMAAGY